MCGPKRILKILKREFADLEVIDIVVATTNVDLG